MATNTNSQNKLIRKTMETVKSSFRKIGVALAITLLIIVSGCSREQKEQTLVQIYQSKAGSYPLTTRHLDDKQQPVFVNQLIKQSSLYLLQHANNPVNWWAWEEGAFAKAKELNKPIFLSIGYSTCHWCHVMARESFEDTQVADFINQHFIPIKVDREEHPAVDELYLTSVQMLSGKAGWPLTAVLTPDGKAFFGGTYFQPNQLLNTLNRINDTWVQRQDAVLEQANRISIAIDKISESSKNTQAIDGELVGNAAARIQTDLMRAASGGQSQSKPGFPREPEILFLLDQAQRTLSESTINTVSDRLLTLAAGGIHDQVGGGFHRYTVDSDWVIPHFEKMLYNQAQMGKAYFGAYEITRNSVFKSIGDKTFGFLLSNMQSPEGGFYSAMDAESENANGVKGEGEYYLWSKQQLTSLLTEPELMLASAHLGYSERGNFNGGNVLQNSTYQSNGSSDQTELTTEIETLLEKLKAERSKRKAPHIDTKIITAWNAMAISALATGYRITGTDLYIEAAKKAANRIWQSSYDEQLGLARTLPTDTQRVDGTLEDYAYLANALIDLYDVDGNKKWLERATVLVSDMIDHFHDAKTGGFQISRNVDSNIPALKLVTARDDAVYSGNSLAAQTLVRMLHRTGKPDYKHKATAAISAFSKQLLSGPEGLSGMLLAANTLNAGEISTKQYAAKGNIALSTHSAQPNNIDLTLNIAEGWHVNASTVLSDYLIPTSLKPLNSEASGDCQRPLNVDYPEGQRVTLGFQEDELLVYEKSVTLNVNREASDQCALAATLNLQACTDEVCLPPEEIHIRAY